MARVVVFLFFVDLVLLLTALIDCISTGRAEIHVFPKSVWILAILLASPFSAVAWFLTGRRRLVETRSRAGHPAGSAMRPARPVAPDDDPEFHRKLGRRARSDEDEVLRRLEDDLRRRDEEPPRGDESSGQVG
jgi:hypothetical protein